MLVEESVNRRTDGSVKSDLGHLVAGDLDEGDYLLNEILHHLGIQSVQYLGDAVGREQVVGHDQAGKGRQVHGAGGWHRFSVVWKSGEIALLIDGVRRITISNPNMPSGFGADAFIGSLTATAHFLNTLHDDLRISSVARTDQEIADAYASGGPLGWTSTQPTRCPLTVT